jgi:TraM recognition site of TraD and TraG
MPKDATKESWAVNVLGLALESIAIIIFNNYLRLWRLVKYRLLGFKDWRIIYGETPTKRQIFDYPKRRNQHTYIKGLTGFGKSSLAVNLAIQNIEHGTAGIFLDPHGNPFAPDDEKGAIVEIFERVSSLQNVVFLTVNQKKLIIGYNPIFLMGGFQKLDKLKDDLLNSIFYHSKTSFNDGHEVINAADFILDSAIYFHSAYFEWLMFAQGKKKEQAKVILQSRQITINDLASLEDNPSLINLFIAILGFKASKYYRPDLVSKWERVKSKKTFDAGFKGVTGRFKKMVSTSKSKLFFESYGFNLLQERKRGKFVLCDLSSLDEFTIAIICKLILVRIYTYQINQIFRGQTEFYIDEAANAEIPNLPHIIAQGRKKKLALTLIFQFIKQFQNPRIIDAICRGIVTKINFKNNEPDFNASLEQIAKLKKQEFIFENSWEVVEKVKALDMPPKRRQVQFEERGAEEKELRARILAKQTDPLTFFKNV